MKEVIVSFIMILILSVVLNWFRMEFFDTRRTRAKKAAEERNLRQIEERNRRLQLLRTMRKELRREYREFKKGL